MNAVGIDVSKGKSMIAVMRPFGEVVASPFEVQHTAGELRKLVAFLKSLTGETRIVMEYTGKYSDVIARNLHETGLFVCMINPILIHGYANNSIRKVKTDKKDAVKIANYALDRWLDLPKFSPAEDIRLLLKTYNRQYNHYMKLKVSLKNNLISLMDQTFPNINTLFTNRPRKSDGHEKWLDFAAQFWHCECVSKMAEPAFTERYRKWCKKTGYHFSEEKARIIYSAAGEQIGILPKDELTKQLVVLAVCQMNNVMESLAVLLEKMNKLASSLPEYPVVMEMHGVGEVFGPQLIAEIGDIHRFRNKGSLVAFAGIDAPPYQSGTFESHNRSISKRGSPALRKTLFQVMSSILQSSSADNEIFLYLDKKRAEGKHYYVYMIAGANKFLRRYYACVKAHLDSLDRIS